MKRTDTPKTYFPGKRAKRVLNISLVLLLLLSLQYLKTDIFFKEKNTPFSGEFFYNPYKDYSINTLKANFHSHSKAWLHLTSGSQKPEEVYKFYKNHGYDIVSLSNYQKITVDSLVHDYIPVYEHGHNIGKSHQLIFNSWKTIFFDFPVVLGYNNRQQVINKLREGGGLIALAHPDLFLGYGKRVMKYLKGYDFIEVFNTFKVSDVIWDAALTGGYPAWILAGDDCHDINNPELRFNCWNRISTKGRSRDDVITALKDGCSYGVMNMNHKELNYLDSCIVRHGTINVYFRNKADRISFIADNGSVKKEVINSATASYKITKEDSYVRVSARNETEMIFLNPVVRYNGIGLNHNNGSVRLNYLLTILVRIIVVIECLAIILFLLLKNGVPNRLFHNFRSVSVFKKL